MQTVSKGTAHPDHSCSFMPSLNHVPVINSLLCVYLISSCTGSHNTEWFTASGLTWGSLLFSADVSSCLQLCASSSLRLRSATIWPKNIASVCQAEEVAWLHELSTCSLFICSQCIFSKPGQEWRCCWFRCVSECRTLFLLWAAAIELLHKQPPEPGAVAGIKETMRKCKSASEPLEATLHG